jgi:hypothetical protein
MDVIQIGIKCCRAVRCTLPLYSVIDVAAPFILVY